MKRVIRYFLKGVLWQNRVVQFFLPVIDLVDYCLRAVNGLTKLPSYSVRVRSNVFDGQLGGRNFLTNGKRILEQLQRNTSISPASDVLEIGCGCGRTAYALTEYLESGSYTGMDIERVSLNDCMNSKYFSKMKNFKFDLLDVHNPEFNPNGKHDASVYKFPYADNSFDVIFLISVFTHMLSDDVENYIKEISRMLRPDGYAMISVFLMDQGTKFNHIDFKYHQKDHYYTHEELPEIAVGYYSDYFNQNFKLHGTSVDFTTVEGRWRTPDQLQFTGQFSQDFLVVRK